MTDYPENNQRRPRRRRGFPWLILPLFVLAAVLSYKAGMHLPDILSHGPLSFPAETSYDSSGMVSGISAITETAPAGGISAVTETASAAEDAAAETAAQDLSSLQDLPTDEYMRSGPFYFYGKLSDEDQTIYRTLYEGLTQMQEDIRIDTDYDHFRVIEELVFADHPSIFWYNGAGSYTAYNSHIVLHPQYSVDAAERASREKLIAEETQRFKDRIAPGETTYERVATAFSFIVRGCSYFEGAPDNQNICSALINHESVCAGYARGMQYLLQQVGIECVFVSGIGTGGGVQQNHAWIIVNIDGTYYHSDPTYGDISLSEEAGADQKIPGDLGIEYGYMCMDDADAFRERSIAPDSPGAGLLPSCDSTENSYYHRHAWFYPEYSETVWNDIARNLKEGQMNWRVQFGTDEAYEQFLAEIADKRFAKLAIDTLRLSSVSTNTIRHDSLRTVVGWIP